MGFEDKILSREISQLIWEKGSTMGTAESCTGGRIAESIIAMLALQIISKGVLSHIQMKSKNPFWESAPNFLKKNSCMRRSCN